MARRGSHGTRGVIGLVAMVSLVTCAYGLGLANDSRMTLHLKVTPRVAFGGQIVRMECRVPRIREYQAVRYGITGPAVHAASERPLPGPVIYTLETTVPRSACGWHDAFCIVAQHDNLGLVRAEPRSVLLIGLGCDLEP